MNSVAKAVLFIVLGVLSLLWFAYEVIGYVAAKGVPPGENPVLYITFAGLKLVMAISWFVAAISSLRKKG